MVLHTQAASGLRKKHISTLGHLTLIGISGLVTLGLSRSPRRASKGCPGSRVFCRRQCHSSSVSVPSVSLASLVPEGQELFSFFFFDWSLPGRADGKSYKPVPSTAMFPGSPGNQVTGCPVFYVTPFVPPPHLRQIRAQHTPTFWVERVDGCFSPQSSTVTSGLPDHRQENESK